MKTNLKKIGTSVLVVLLATVIYNKVVAPRLDSIGK